MELFFLCTIIMAGISFLSIALSQPPVNYTFKFKGKSTVQTKQREDKGEASQVTFGSIQAIPELATFSVAS